MKSVENPQLSSAMSVSQSRRVRSGRTRRIRHSAMPNASMATRKRIHVAPKGVITMQIKISMNRPAPGTEQAG